MALTLGDNFSYQGAKPLDARLTYSTVAAMKAVADATMYDGCMGYCTETEKTYQWKSTNTVDETLGKWREFQAGGGGATYEAGDGIDITDDTISVDPMPAEDMDEIMTPAPGIHAKRIKYSTDEQVIGEWIDGKPVYQKTLIEKLPNSNGETIIDLSSLNIDNIYNFTGIHFSSSYWGIIPVSNVENGTTYTIFPYYIRSSGSLRIYNSISAYYGRDICITIQYTKTTD